MFAVIPFQFWGLREIAPKGSPRWKTDGSIDVWPLGTPFEACGAHCIPPTLLQCSVWTIVGMPCRLVEFDCERSLDCEPTCPGLRHHLEFPWMSRPFLSPVPAAKMAPINLRYRARVY